MSVKNTTTTLTEKTMTIAELAALAPDVALAHIWYAVKADKGGNRVSFYWMETPTSRPISLILRDLKVKLSYYGESKQHEEGKAPSLTFKFSHGELSKEPVTKPEERKLADIYRDNLVAAMAKLAFVFASDAIPYAMPLIAFQNTPLQFAVGSPKPMCERMINHPNRAGVLTKIAPCQTLGRLDQMGIFSMVAKFEQKYTPTVILQKYKDAVLGMGKGTPPTTPYMTMYCPKIDFKKDEVNSMTNVIVDASHYEPIMAESTSKTKLTNMPVKTPKKTTAGGVLETVVLRPEEIFDKGNQKPKWGIVDAYYTPELYAGAQATSFRLPVKMLRFHGWVPPMEANDIAIEEAADIDMSSVETTALAGSQ